MLSFRSQNEPLNARMGQMSKLRAEANGRWRSEQEVTQIILEVSEWHLWPGVYLSSIYLRIGILGPCRGPGEDRQKGHNNELVTMGNKHFPALLSASPLWSGSVTHTFLSATDIIMFTSSFIQLSIELLSWTR